MRSRPRVEAPAPRVSDRWSQLADALLRWRVPLALLCLLVSALAAVGLARTAFTTDYRAYFSQDNPELASLEALERNFSRAETLLVAVEALDGDVFTVDTLRAVRALTDAWPRLPYAKGSVSVTDYYDAFADGDDIAASPLIPERPIDEHLPLDEIRARALAEPRLLHGLLAPAGDVTGVVFYFELPHREPATEIRAVAEAARTLVGEVQSAHPGVRLHTGGIILFNEAMAEAIEWNARNLYPLAYLLMFGLLMVFFRGFSGTVGTLAVTLMSVATAMGAAGWLGITLTAASITAGVVVMTLAIADCVHLLATYAGKRESGLDSSAALRESLRINAQAILLTSVTTALGFLGMNFSDSPPFRDLGNLVAIGVIAAWLFTLGFMPAWLHWFEPGSARLVGDPARRMRAVADWIIARHRAVFVVTATVLVLMAAGLPRNQFGDNYVRFFDESSSFRQAAEFTNERLTGMQYLEYGVEADGPGGVYEPAFLGRVDALVNWMREQPEVVKVSVITDLLKRLNETMHGGDTAHYALPSSRELAAQYLLFYEMSLPTGVDVSHMVNLEKSAVRLTVQLNTLGSGEVRAFDDKVAQWQRANWPEAMHSRGSGISMMFANIAMRNFSSMLVGTGIAFAIICVLLFRAFGSVRLGLISLVPNLVPALAGFGLWGYLVGQVGMSLSIVVSLTLGIVVDDTIHLLSRYARARREMGLDAAGAIREAYASVGVALWITSCALVAGFAVLGSSTFKLTADLGQLAGLVVVLALVADFLLLPALLLWLDRDPPKDRAA